MTSKNGSGLQPGRCRRFLFQGATLLALLLAVPAPGGADELRLSVAASLTELITDACSLYRQTHTASNCLINAGGSGTLARQIEQGAPVDLFIPASCDWLDQLLRQGLLDATTVVPLAANRLVFVGRPGAATRLEDLPQLRRIALGSPRSVPAGAYAVEALQKVGSYATLAAQGRLVLAQDVRQALIYAERGEVDGAFVYRSDALRARQAVILFDVDARLHAPIVYSAALTPAGANKTEARDFLQFLQSATVQALLQRHGFALYP